MIKCCNFFLIFYKQTRVQNYVRYPPGQNRNWRFPVQPATTDPFRSTRSRSHGEFIWGPPGGPLEFGESFEECAIREVLEETGLHIRNPAFLAVINDVFEKEGKHYVSVFMKAPFPPGQQVQNLEPHKTTSWQWFHLHDLPSPLFTPLQNFFSGNYYGEGIIC